MESSNLLIPDHYIAYFAERDELTGKIRKSPADPRTGQFPINPHDRKYWLSREEAEERIPGLGDGYRLAYVLSEDDPYVFLDIDHCRNPDGSWSALAVELADSLPKAYLEQSISGNGLHLIFSATHVPPHACKNAEHGLELYHTGRFIALTGAMAEGSAEEDYTEELALLIEQYFKPTAEAVAAEWTTGPCPEWDGSPDNPVLLANARNNESFSALWNLDLDKLRVRYPDPVRPYDASSADMALALHLAYWTGKDCDRIEGLMRASKLKREKWDKHKTYLRDTILKACANCKEVYSPKDVVHEVGSVSREGYRLLSAREVAKLPPLEWMVKSVLPTEGIAALYGPSGSGKSFLALDLAAYIASEKEWFGYRVLQANVVYIALEGTGGFSQRLMAWENHHGQDLPDALQFIMQDFDLRNSESVLKLVEAVIASNKAGGLLIIDTLNRASSGADENSSQDMGEIIDACKLLQEKLGGLVMLIHHTGKDAAKGLRGHSSLHAAMDAEIEVERSGDLRSWKIAKAKDGEDGKEHGFLLEKVSVGVDELGVPVASCVVVQDKNTPSRNTVRKPTGKNQIVALSTLKDMLQKSTEFGRGELPNKPCVALDRAIEKIAPLLILNDGSRKAERAKEAIHGLHASGFISHSNGWICIP